MRGAPSAAAKPEQGRIDPGAAPIVVGWDGSDDARRAADWAVGLVAAGRGGVVHLTRSLGLPGVPHALGGLTVDELIERHEESARVELDAERTRLALRGATIEVHLRRWPPIETLLEHAAATGAALIVLGQHGHGPERLLLGSVSAAVVRAARCPVVVVRGATSVSPPRRALLAFDGSEAASAAGAALARWAPAASVLAVHVRSGESSLDSESILAALAAAGLDRGRVEPRLVDGAPAEALLEAATAEGVDLVAAGRRGHATWRRLVLGGVSDKLLQLAPCPVLVAH